MDEFLDEMGEPKENTALSDLLGGDFWVPSHIHFSMCG